MPVQVYQKLSNLTSEFVTLQPLSLRVIEEVYPVKAKLEKRREIQGESNKLPRVIYYYPGSVRCTFIVLIAQYLPLQGSIQTALQQGPRGISPYRDYKKWVRHLTDNPRQPASCPSAFSGLKPPALEMFQFKGFQVFLPYWLITVVYTSKDKRKQNLSGELS